MLLNIFEVLWLPKQILINYNGAGIPGSIFYWHDGQRFAYCNTQAMTLKTDNEGFNSGKAIKVMWHEK